MVYGEIDETELEESSLVKHLRKEIAERDRILKTKDAELDQVRTVSRNATLSDILKGKNIPEKVARFFPSDVEPTPESVSEWLAGDGDVFVPAGVDAADAESTEVTEEPKSPVPSETVAAVQKMQSVQAAGTQGASALGSEAVLKEIQNLRGQGADAVTDYLRAHGMSST